MLKTIKDITPIFQGYDEYTKDDNGKIILPRVPYEVNGKTLNVIVIYRKNTISYGNGLIGLLDGTKIADNDWVELRKRFVIQEEDGTQKFFWCIGGSDTGGLCNVSSYANARTVYDTKTSDITPVIDDATDYLYAYGHVNEELIARGFATVYDKTVVKNNTVFFREDTGFMQANVDYLVDRTDENGNQEWYVLEIKSTNPNSTTLRDYFKQETVPPYYYTQTLHYSAVLGAAFPIKGFYFAVGYDNSLSNIIGVKFDRDEAAEKELMEVEYNLISNIRGQVPPALTDGVILPERLKNNIEKLFPMAVEKSTFDLSESGVSAVQKIQQLQEEQKTAKKALDEIEREIEKERCILINEIGENEESTPFTIEGQKYFVSYPNSKRVTIDSKILKDRFPNVYEQVKRENYSRRLSIKKAKVSKK